MSQKHGFTLIELSVVLIIVGLVIAAVTAGSTLVKQAGLRAVIAEVEETQSHINVFQSKFRALPGDFTNAGALWGDDCADTTGGSDTCSGNGDGYTNDAIGATTSESLRAWQHLTRAKIATYGLTGLPSDTDLESSAIGVNIPDSSISNGGYFFHSGSADNIKLALFLGTPVSDGWPSDGVISPPDLYTIDQKSDDGTPTTGNIRFEIAGKSGDDSGTCASGGVYLLGNAGLNYCTPAFIMVGQ